MILKAAATAEATKVRKYAEISRQYDFVAFAVETLGPWCQGAKDFFKALAPKLIEATGDRKAGVYFTQRISLAVQRGNAASFYDFEYVVVPKEKPKVCFGSGIQRKCLPLTGPQLESFMRRFTPMFTSLSPVSYPAEKLRGAFSRTQHRPISLRGLGSRTPRFTEKREYQPLPQPPTPPRPVKQNCAPFNSTKPRVTQEIKSTTPSASDYYALYKKRELTFAYCFGGKKVLRCAVQIKCVPYNLDVCGVCEQLLSPQGDYWHFENRIFLCRKHYAILFKSALAKYNGAKLLNFKPIRDCFFAHVHNSCRAAVKIMTIEQIVMQLRKEAYLDLYFPQRKNYG